MYQWQASTKELCPWGQQGLGKISVPPVTPFLSGAGCAGTAPLILISKRREIPQRDELLILHPKEHPQKWKPLHLCLTCFSQQELGQEGIWDR